MIVIEIIYLYRFWFFVGDLSVEEGITTFVGGKRHYKPNNLK